MRSGSYAPIDLPMPIATLDERLRVAATNRAFDDLVALTPEGVIGRDIIDLMSAAAASCDLGGDRRLFHLRADDDDRFMRLDLQRHGGAMLAILVDVTLERRELEDIAFANLTRAQLMRDADVEVWRYDPDQKTCHLGADREDPRSVLTLERLAQVLHPEDAPADAEARERLTQVGGSDVQEIRRRDGRGGWEHLQINYRAGRRTPSGLYELYGLTQNVTAVATARDEAQEAARRLKLALHAARAGALEYDCAEDRVWMSPELTAMVPPDVLAASQTDHGLLFHEDDRKALLDLDRRLRAGVRADALDARLRVYGGLRWVRIYLEVQSDELGQPGRVIGLAIDIDEQKRQELALTEARQAAEAATEAKSMFLAAISHEIRTPMNGIVGVLNLLRREPLSPESQHLLTEALACSGMLGQLIDDVLDFSKIEAGRLDLSAEPCNPFDIARSVADLIRPQADAKGLTLTVSTTGEAEVVALDPLRLRQCLFNVIGNAVKFTERGHVAVRLVYVRSGDERRLRCEVQDTGVGVPEAARATLFERFRQADGGTTRRFGGTGLGLAISRSLARMMGGDMDFVSQEGVGSTFWFEVVAPPGEAAAGDGASVADRAPLAGVKILVVDDNATNRLIAVKSLEALGAAAGAVDSGEAAIAAVEDGYDLVLMDINMPCMDGLEATRRIRALPTPAAATPVVALTADVMSHRPAAYAAAGVNGLVSKPFSTAALLAAIARVADDEPPAAVANG